MTISSQITYLKQKVNSAILQFSQGHPILIGDDGKRENEVDFVFHASFATKEIVNFALSHAKGLLCVALDHAVADHLGFFTAPSFPGSMPHTNFTLSVDAKNNVTSGISAQDRATTIKLMASPQAKPSDFITPGHVFPLRAMEGGLSSRAGHTEALFELCQLSHLTCAAAMCEVLDELGEPITPAQIQENRIFSKIPYISTVDLLWYKILFTQNKYSYFHEIECENKFIFRPVREEFHTLPCAVQFHSQKFNPQSLRIVLNNGFFTTDNGVTQENCCAEIVLFSYEKIDEVLPSNIHEFCDLSEKVGLKNTKTSVKRFISLMRAFQLIEKKMETKLTPTQLIEIQFPVKGDKELIDLFNSN